MATKTYAQLNVQTTVQDGDLLASYRGAGPLKSVTALILQTYMSALSLQLTGGTMTGALKIANGAEGTPLFSFGSETTTGIYRSGAGNLDISILGTRRVNLSATGMQVFGTVAATGFTGPLTGNVTGNLTGNVTGAVTGNATTATAWATARALSFTGDATGSGSVDGSAAVATALTLATVNTDVGTYGSTSAIPVITVDGKGRITAVTTATAGIGSVAYSTDHTLQISDAQKSVLFALGASTMTIPTNATVAIPVNSLFSIKNVTGGTLAISSAGVTVVYLDSLATPLASATSAWLQKIGSDLWYFWR